VIQGYKKTFSEIANMKPSKYSGLKYKDKILSTEEINILLESIDNFESLIETSVSPYEQEAWLKRLFHIILFCYQVGLGVPDDPVIKELEEKIEREAPKTVTRHARKVRSGKKSLIDEVVEGEAKTFLAEKLWNRSVKELAEKLLPGVNVELEKRGAEQIKVSTIRARLAPFIDPKKP
jgi:hypothetical protein